MRATRRVAVHIDNDDDDNDDDGDDEGGKFIHEEARRGALRARTIYDSLIARVRYRGRTA